MTKIDGAITSPVGGGGCGAQKRRYKHHLTYPFNFFYMKYKPGTYPIIVLWISEAFLALTNYSSIGRQIADIPRYFSPGDC